LYKNTNWFFRVQFCDVFLVYLRVSERRKAGTGLQHILPQYIIPGIKLLTWRRGRKNWRNTSQNWTLKTYLS
jgi:hypothetical protein